MPITQSVWTTFPHLIIEMKKLFADNLAFSAIAIKLGHGLNRNAVIGKCTRIGLKRNKPNGGNHTNHTAKIERKKERLHFARSHPIEVYVEELDMTPAPADTEIPIAQRKTVMTIGMDDCRFPVGDPSQDGFFFCGAPKLESTPYCKHHSDRCFVPNTRR